VRFLVVLPIVVGAALAGVGGCIAAIGFAGNNIAAGGFQAIGAGIVLWIWNRLNRPTNHTGVEIEWVRAEQGALVPSAEALEEGLPRLTQARERRAQEASPAFSRIPY
jgi:hypothetical protein